MRKKRISQIQKQYRFNEENNVYLIDVSLDDYDDVYDEWDPAPFKKRFIEEEFDEFIVSSSEDIPLKYDINIVLYIPEAKKEVNKENSVVSAYRNYYAYAIEKVNKSRKRLRKINISYFLLAIILLSIGYFFQNGTESVLLDVLNEGVFIGGWVFLWEVFTNIFIIRRDIQTKNSIYKRLYLSDIIFVYV
ncbi:MAG: hypothetical protein K0R15_1547 [Clostridiales bacterium]|jgi:hypothetical protein|nr:hypothetical protein [Clostridiales bacterium]